MEKDTACIFNIQKFSLQDGPGIRTVVFFKGCPLHCGWCSNPESQYSRQDIMFDDTKCVRCLACAAECPAGAITVQNNKPVFHYDVCQACLGCVEICPAGALGLQGQNMSLQKVKLEVMKDLPFYEESGGGVTLSGGEVLQQAEFATALLTELKQAGIHTACETSGYAEKTIFRAFIESVDLLLFDLKHYDRVKHLQATNVYPDEIWSNLQAAIAAGKEILLRIPVIPGVNDALADAQGFCDLIKNFGLKKVQLLPFHQFGQNKYSLLHRTYQFENKQGLQEEDLLPYCDVFLKNGLSCKF